MISALPAKSCHNVLGGHRSSRTQHGKGSMQATCTIASTAANISMGSPLKASCSRVQGPWGPSKLCNLSANVHGAQQPSDTMITLARKQFVRQLLMLENHHTAQYLLQLKHSRPQDPDTCEVEISSATHNAIGLIGKPLIFKRSINTWTSTVEVPIGRGRNHSMHGFCIPGCSA